MRTFIAVTLISLAAAAAAALSPPAAAETAAAPAAAGSRVYLSGGAGAEERSAMQARAAEFPQQIVFSGEAGEYMVARQLTIVARGAPESQLVAIADAGPIVMLRLPAGTYEAAAVFDGRIEQRALAVSGEPQTLSWRVAGAGR